MKAWLFILVAASLLITSLDTRIEGRAHAYTIHQRCVGSNQPSWKKDEQFFELCGNPWFDPPEPAGGDDEFRGRAAGVLAMLHAFQAWGGDGISSHQSFVIPNWCISGPENGEWFDRSGRRGDRLSAVWYESTDIISGVCPGTAIGCASQRYTCASTRDILSADIMISNTQVYDVAAQDRVADCVRNISYVSLENLWIHEIGHTYTIGHVNAGLYAHMTTGSQRVRNCHVGRLFADAPFPDDVNALMAEHGTSLAASAINLSGTAWYYDAGNPHGSVYGDNDLITLNPLDVRGDDLRYTLNVYYNGGVRIDVGGWLVPDDDPNDFPLPDGDGWIFPDGSIELLSVRVNIPSSTQSFTMVEDFPFIYSPSGFVPWQTYRLWLHIDKTNVISETLEDDNVFPTGYRVQVSSTATGGCNG